MDYISTTTLAKERNLEPQSLFKTLSEKGWIYKKDEKWHLTKEGEIAGGKMAYNPKFGEFITWPTNIDLEKKSTKYSETFNATKIGEKFLLSARRINTILEELGWIENKKGFGWFLTNEGKNNGGFEMESIQGTKYVVWSEKLFTNTFFLKSVNIATGKNYENEIQDLNENIDITEANSTDEYRLKYKAKIRTQDGHYVRSRAEAMIDDYLYQNGISHAYERKVPVEDDILSDFYIPKAKVYIEFWGMEENEKYANRKKEKLELYAKHKCNLIELTEKDLNSLDDVLPRKLLKFEFHIE